MNELDPRIIRVGVQVNGRLKVYSSPLFISVNGMKYGNSLQNECEIVLTNLDRTTQDYILTETSPYNLNRTPKIVTVEAGRQSYGTALIYRGNVVTSRLTQPPDVGVYLKCMTGNFVKGNVISRNQPGSASLRQILSQVAQDTGTILNFQATDKNIANYNFAGSALKQIDLVNTFGGINAFIDDDVLVCKDAFIPLNDSLRILNADTGMIGIPEFTEQGIKVKFLLDNKTRLGSSLRITSTQNPAVNGDYVVYKLGFELSTRDTPFYYIAEAARRRPV